MSVSILYVQDALAHIQYLPFCGVQVDLQRGQLAACTKFQCMQVSGLFASQRGQLPACTIKSGCALQTSSSAQHTLAKEAIQGVWNSHRNSVVNRL